MSLDIAIRDTLPCPPPALMTAYELIDEARKLATQSDIMPLGALAILVEREELPVAVVYQALEYLRNVAQLQWLVDLVRGADDDELAFICGGICNCQSCARKYLMDPVTCEIDTDMLLETTRVGWGEAWVCDGCHRSFSLPSERERAWR